MFTALLGAGASLASSLLGNSANKKARAQEYANQKEFAQSGIQWKVEDAKKAGIHPLYALGANTVSYSPQSVGGSDFSGLANAGQNIGRAIDATRSGGQKAQALATTLAQIQIEGAQLDNDIKRASLNSAMATNRAMQTPNMPAPNTEYQMPGQGNTPEIKGPVIEMEKKISPANRHDPHSEYGEAPDVTYSRTPTGWAPMIPQQMAESLESDTPGRYQWYFRNKVAPIGSSHDGSNPYFRPPPVPLAHGQKWIYNAWAGEWQIKTGRPDHYVPRR